ncbi:GNAT family N-acetyltransferase, partial [Mycobacterium tuberculosis]|nr:GNAT family N-acetyltransferase [Mycobacterium tuberculosis]
MLAEARRAPPERLMLNGVIDGEVMAHGQVHLDHRNGVARFGRFVIAPQRRGQGLAAPFARAIIERAFAVPGMVRLELVVYTHN